MIYFFEYHIQEVNLKNCGPRMESTVEIGVEKLKHINEIIKN